MNMLVLRVDIRVLRAWVLNPGKELAVLSVINTSLSHFHVLFYNIKYISKTRHLWILRLLCDIKKEVAEWDYRGCQGHETSSQRAQKLTRLSSQPHCVYARTLANYPHPNFETCTLSSGSRKLSCGDAEVMQLRFSSLINANVLFILRDQRCQDPKLLFVTDLIFWNNPNTTGKIPLAFSGGNHSWIFFLFWKPGDVITRSWFRWTLDIWTTMKINSTHCAPWFINMYLVWRIT